MLATIYLNLLISCNMTSAAYLFNGSVGLGDEKSNINPKSTSFNELTGFQSSRRIFKQTFPSRSIFGWKIRYLHLNITYLLAEDLRRLDWIFFHDLNRELDLSSLPVAVIRSHFHFKVHDILRVREFQFNLWNGEIFIRQFLLIVHDSLPSSARAFI